MSAAAGCRRPPKRGRPRDVRGSRQLRRRSPWGSCDFGSRPAQRRCNLVGDDLDDAALLAVRCLPAALLEPTGDDHAVALGQRLADVLGKFGPADDVEEADLLLPVVGLAIHPPPVHGHAEHCPGAAGLGESKFGIAGEITHHGDGVVSHDASA